MEQMWLMLLKALGEVSFSANTFFFIINEIVNAIAFKVSCKYWLIQARKPNLSLSDIRTVILENT